MASKKAGKAKSKTAPRKAAKTTKAKAKPSTRKGSARVVAPNKHDLFVQEYLIDLNGAQAAIRAGYKPQYARQTANELLARQDVQAKVQAAMDERAERTGIDAADVLKRLWSIATADPRELIELHRGCCRYCWGKDNLYQRTQREMEEARAAFERQKAEVEAECKGKGSRVCFNEGGGTGYNPKLDPNPDCPECFGDGEERVVAKDTRDLSPDARLLYAGVKTTQHGLEIKMHDQTGMLVNVGRHLGLFKERVELTGKNGGPVEHQTVASILDDIDGAGTGLPAHGNRGS